MLRITKKTLMKGGIIFICFFFFTAVVFAGGEKEGTGSAAEKEQVNLKMTTWITGGGTNEKEMREMYDTVTEDFKEKSGVGVSYDFIPVEQWATWLTTQFAASNEPPVFGIGLARAPLDYDKGYLLNLYPYAQEPNPYEKGIVWKDTFQQHFYEACLHPTEENVLPCLPRIYVVVRVFYNKDIFEASGVDGVPKTWIEFMDAQEKIKAAGYTPFGFPNTKYKDHSWIWSIRSIANTLLVDDVLPQVDIDGNGMATFNEFAKAWDKGLYNFTESPMQDVFHLMKEWQPYWNDDFNATTEEEVFEMFLREEVAMGLFGSWFMRPVLEMGDDLGFNVGVFPFPMITEETNIHSANISSVHGAIPDGNVAVSARVEGAKKEAAIEFVQYLTSSYYAEVASEIMYSMSPLKTFELRPELSGFVLQPYEEIIALDVLKAPLSEEFAVFNQRMGQLYLTGELGHDEFMQQMQSEYDQVIKDLKMSNKWTPENNYGTKK